MCVGWGGAQVVSFKMFLLCICLGIGEQLDRLTGTGSQGE